MHTAVTAIGLSTVFVSFPLAYEIVRFVGAVYLVCLGIRMIYGRSRLIKKGSDSKTTNQTSLKEIFRQGVFTNVLNPKVALFFLSFLPQFIVPSHSFALQIALLGLMFDASATTFNILIATLAGHVRSLLSKRSELSKVQGLLPGVILVGLGVLVAL